MSMKETVFHTPEGYRDIIGEHCEQKLSLEEELLKTIYSYGYHPIELPTVEFASLYTGSSTSMSDSELYRFFDRDGNMLSLRPDFTPSVARTAVKYFEPDVRTVRLCYHGKTFVNYSNYQGRLRESTQIGAELIGDRSADADAEVIALVIDSLLKAGLTQFQLTLGHAGFFDGLVRETDLSEADVEELKKRIRNHNRFAVREWLREKQLPENVSAALSALPELFGAADVLDQAASYACSESSRKAVGRLREVYDILCLYGMGQYVSFDLGMLGNFMYYTGIIFRGYTYGAGEAIVKGGRYDRLLASYGKDAPATGFVIVIDQLLEAMKRQKLPLRQMKDVQTLTFTEDNREQVIKEAMALRGKGIRVQLLAAGEDK